MFGGERICRFKCNSCILQIHYMDDEIVMWALNHWMAEGHNNAKPSYTVSNYNDFASIEIDGPKDGTEHYHSIAEYNLYLPPSKTFVERMEKLLVLI